jgi:hypothetical protein
MLVIKIELWPHGDETKKELIGYASLVNDGTGTNQTGNYDFTIFKNKGKNKVTTKSRVTAFRRLWYGPWKLLYLSLQDVFEDKNVRD